MLLDLFNLIPKDSLKVWTHWVLIFCLLPYSETASLIWGQ